MYTPHTRTHTQTDTYITTYRHTYMRTYIHACIHTIPTHVTYIQIDRHAYIHCLHTYLPTYIHADHKPSWKRKVRPQSQNSALEGPDRKAGFHAVPAAQLTKA